MNDKTKTNPRVLVVVFGVLAVLFAVFGFQQQMEAAAMKKELEELRTQIQDVIRQAQEQQALGAEIAKQANERQADLSSQLANCLLTKKK